MQGKSEAADNTAAENSSAAASTAPVAHSQATTGADRLSSAAPATTAAAAATSEEGSAVSKKPQRVTILASLVRSDPAMAQPRLSSAPPGSNRGPERLTTRRVWSPQGAWKTLFYTNTDDPWTETVTLFAEQFSLLLFSIFFWGAREC
jgi:hypothetical protein